MQFGGIRARYYDPSLGRFLQKDPEPGRLSLPVTVVNSYAYAGNSPLKLTDPSGRSFLGDLVLAALITAAAVFTAGAAAVFMIELLDAAGTAFAPVIGAVSGAVSGAIAGGIVGAIGYGVQGRSTAEGFASGMIQGAIAGFVAGAIIGFNSWAAGKNPVAQPDQNPDVAGESSRAESGTSNASLETDGNISEEGFKKIGGNIASRDTVLDTGYVGHFKTTIIGNINVWKGGICAVTAFVMAPKSLNLGAALYAVGAAALCTYVGGVWGGNSK